MYVCFIDESGEAGILDPSNNNTSPTLIISGIFIMHDFIRLFTQDFVALKKKFYPKLTSAMSSHDIIKVEIKGAELRKPKLLKNRDKWEHTKKFITECLKLFKKYEIKFVSRVYIKSPGSPTNANSMYTTSIQYICTEFQHFLAEKNDIGAVISDSRNFSENVIVSHSIFTQMFKASGDNYSRIIEMPTYGHSDNHSGLQMCDILCSALLFPMACHAFCLPRMEELKNVHIQPSHRLIRDTFAGSISDLQYRRLHDKKRVGGIFVSNLMTNIHPNEILKKSPRDMSAPASKESITKLMKQFSITA